MNMSSYHAFVLNSMNEDLNAELEVARIALRSKLDKAFCESAASILLKIHDVKTYVSTEVSQKRSLDVRHVLGILSETMSGIEMMFRLPSVVHTCDRLMNKKRRWYQTNDEDIDFRFSRPRLL